MTAEYTTPQYDRSALITIDMQRDFLDGQAFEIRGTTGVVPTIGRIAGFFRSKSRPIVHVVRLYQPDGKISNLEGQFALGR